MRKPFFQIPTTSYLLGRFLLMVLLLLGASLQELPGRYLTRDDFNVITKEHRQEIQLTKEGKKNIRTKIIFQIVKDEGRKELSTHNIIYNRATTKTKIIKASVTNGKKTIKVSRENIVDNPMIASAHGFDATNMIKIAFPQLKKGSLIEIEYSQTEENTALQDHFSEFVHFGLDSYQEKKFFKITSDQQIYHELNDPWKVVHISSKKNKEGKFVISAELKRPFGKLSSLQALQMDMDKFTFLLLSTDKSVAGLIEKFYSHYEEVINAPLTPTLKKIADKTREKKSLEDKVNYAISQIIEEYNYLGDWRTVQGQLIPKGFKKLEKTKYGDCKDFASALTAILRKSHVKAWVAWANRGSVFLNKDYKTDLILMKGFNHAIVYIKDENGKEFWVDPTNNYANGLKLNDDIAHAESLVLNPEIKKLKKLPSINYEEHQLETEHIYIFENIKKASVQTKVHLSGRYSALLTAAEKKLSGTKIENLVSSLGSIGGEKDFVIFSPYSLKDRVNKKLSFSFKHTAPAATTEEKKEHYFSLPQGKNVFPVFNQKTKNRTGNIFLGLPYIFKRKIVLKGVYFSGKRVPKCNIDTKWLTLKTHIQEHSDSIVYHEKVTLKKFEVKKSDFKSTDYQLLTVDLNRCYRNRHITMTFGSNKDNNNKSQSKKLNKIFSDLPLKNRIEKRYHIAKQVLSNVGKSVDYEYNLDDAYYLLELNINEDPRHENSYLVQESVIRSLGLLSSSNYSSSSLAEAEHLIEKGIQELGPTGKLLLDKSYLFYLKSKGVKGKGKKENYIKQAISLTKRALKAKGLVRDSMFLNSLAGNYSSFGTSEQFLKTIKELREKFYTNDEALLSLELDIANFYLGKKQWKKCIKHYENYLEKVKNNRFSYNNVGICYRNQKEFEKSIESYKKALALARFGAAEHGLLITYIQKGRSLILAKKFKEARLVLHQALALRSHEDAYYYLAVVDFLQENVEEGMINLTKVLERTSKYGERVHLLQNIFKLIQQVGKNKISNLSEKLLKTISTTQERLLVASMIIHNLYHRRIHNTKKIAQMYDLIKEIEIENPDMVQHNDYVKLGLASSYFMVAIMKNDIPLFEKSISLIDGIKDQKKYAKEMNNLKNSINIFNHKTGRKPASLYWKAKRKTHLILQKQFDYRLIDLGFPKP